jgi:hypothetical protein
MGFILITPSIQGPIIAIVSRPFLVAQPLILAELGIGAHFGTLPGRLFGPPAFGLQAIGLVLMPRTGWKKITAVNANNRFHDHHLWDCGLTVWPRW